MPEWSRAIGSFALRLMVALCVFFIACAVMLSFNGWLTEPSPTWDAYKALTPVDYAWRCVWYGIGLYDFEVTTRPEAWYVAYDASPLARALVPVHLAAIDLTILCVPFLLFLSRYDRLTSRYVESRCGVCGARLTGIRRSACIRCGSPL